MEASGELIKGEMKKLAITLLMLIFSHPVSAEWVKYSQNFMGLSYYDPTTVKMDGNIVRVWVFTDLAARIDGQWSRRALKEFDCKEMRHRNLQQTSFSGQRMSGEIDSQYSFARPGNWKATIPGSPYDRLQSIICQ